VDAVGADEGVVEGEGRLHAFGDGFLGGWGGTCPS
jgi:hypothetical protein